MDGSGDTLRLAVQSHLGAALSKEQLDAFGQMLAAVVELNTTPQA